MASPSPIKGPAAAPTEELTVDAVEASPLEHGAIARLAYSFWEERGRPEGSPEEDWLRAEQELRARQTG